MDQGDESSRLGGGDDADFGVAAQQHASVASRGEKPDPAQLRTVVVAPVAEEAADSHDAVEPDLWAELPDLPERRERNRHPA